MKQKRIRKSACVPAALRACGLRTSHLNSRWGYDLFEIGRELAKSGMRYKGVFWRLQGKSVKRIKEKLIGLRGKFLVILNDHALAVVNGIVYDTWQTRDLKRVENIIEIRDCDFPPIALFRA